MVDTVRYVDPTVVGGSQNGVDAANAYISWDQWFAAEAGTIAAGDRHIVNFLGNAEDAASAIIDFNAGGWVITGELHLVGNATSGAKLEADKYRLKLYATTKTFNIDDAGTGEIHFYNFQRIIDRANNIEGMWLNSDSTSSLSRIVFNDSVDYFAQAAEGNQPWLKAEGTAAVSCAVDTLRSSVIGTYDKLLDANYVTGFTVNAVKSTFTPDQLSLLQTGSTAPVFTDCALQYNTLSTKTAPTLDYCATIQGDGTNGTTVANWAAQFVDSANQDYTLAQGSVLLDAATAGANIGADQATESVNPAIQSVGAILPGATGVAIEVTNFGGDITSIELRTADDSHSIAQSNVSGTGTSFTFDVNLPLDVATVPFSSATHANLIVRASDGTDTADATVTVNPFTGYKVVDLSGITQAMIDDQYSIMGGWTGGIPADGSQLIIPTSVDLAADYKFEFDADFTGYFWDVSDGKLKSFTVTANNSAVSPFNFTDVTGATRGAVVESNEITIAGIDAGVDVAVTVTNGDYAVDAGGGYGAWTSTSTNVQLGYKIKVRGTAAAGYLGNTDVTLDVGGRSDTFTITSEANQSPNLVANISNQNSDNGAVISFDISTFFSDPLGDTLTYSVTGGALPSGLSLNANTGEITGVLDTVAVLSGIVITASDGSLTVDSNAFSWTVNSTATNTPATGQPTIAGTAQEGQMLVADTAAIVDPDGFGPFSYQWQRNGVNISGATAVNYTLVAADVGSAIRVVVSFTDGLGYSESVISNYTPIVAALGVNNPATGQPLIIGTAQEGQLLTIDTSLIADADGMGAFSYQWQRNGTDIAGATASNYTPVAADVGAVLRVVVSYTDGQGYFEELTSANTAVVVAIPAVVSVRDMVDLPDVDGSGFDVPKYKQFVGEEWPYSWDFSDQATKRQTTIQSVTWESVGAVPVTISYPQMNGNLALAVVSGESVGPAIVRVTCRYANAQDRIRFFKVNLSDEAIA